MPAPAETGPWGALTPNDRCTHNANSRGVRPRFWGGRPLPSGLNSPNRPTVDAHHFQSTQREAVGCTARSATNPSLEGRGGYARREEVAVSLPDWQFTLTPTPCHDTRRRRLRPGWVGTLCALSALGSTRQGLPFVGGQINRCSRCARRSCRTAGPCWHRSAPPEPGRCAGCARPWFQSPPSHRPTSEHRRRFRRPGARACR